MAAYHNISTDQFQTYSSTIYANKADQDDETIRQHTSIIQDCFTQTVDIIEILMPQSHLRNATNNAITVLIVWQYIIIVSFASLFVLYFFGVKKQRYLRWRWGAQMHTRTILEVRLSGEEEEEELRSRTIQLAYYVSKHGEWFLWKVLRLSNKVVSLLVGPRPSICKEYYLISYYLLTLKARRRQVLDTWYKIHC